MSEEQRRSPYVEVSFYCRNCGNLVHKEIVKEGEYVRQPHCCLKCGSLFMDREVRALHKDFEKRNSNV